MTSAKRLPRKITVRVLSEKFPQARFVEYGHEEAQAIREHVKNGQHYQSFFVLMAPDDTYIGIWGMAGSVPDMGKYLTRIYKRGY